MTIDKQFVPPALPLPPGEYAATYHNELNKVLRLYFNLLNLHLDEVVNVLNFTGPFDTIYADMVEASAVNTDLLTALKAVISNLQAGTISSGSFQGGNAVFDNMTAAQANASLFTGSGREINFPHIGASGNADQYATATDTPTIVQWDTADEALGFTLNNDYTATATYDGIYKITYGLQFANTANAAHDVFIWLRVNGVDVPKSAVKYTLPARVSAGVPSFLLCGSSIVFNIEAGQSVGLWWATDLAAVLSPASDGVYIEYLPAQTTPYAHPAVPASIGDIVYVSAPDPARTRVTPVGVAASGEVGTVITAVVST